MSLIGVCLRHSIYACMACLRSLQPETPITAGPLPKTGGEVLLKFHQHCPVQAPFQGRAELWIFGIVFSCALSSSFFLDLEPKRLISLPLVASSSFFPSLLSSLPKKMRLSYSGSSKLQRAAGAVCLLSAAQLSSTVQAHAIPFNGNGTSASFSSSSSASATSASSSSSGNSTVGALQSCLQNLNTVFPYSGSYSQDAAPFNQAFNWKPAVIVYPQSTNDVSQAVKCAASSGYKVSARAGGHSYAAYGLGGEE